MGEDRTHEGPVREITIRPWFSRRSCLGGSTYLVRVKEKESVSSRPIPLSPLRKIS